MIKISEMFLELRTVHCWHLLTATAALTRTFDRLNISVVKQ